MAGALEAHTHPAGTFGAAVAYSGAEAVDGAAAAVGDASAAADGAASAAVDGAASAAAVGDARQDNLWALVPHLEDPIEEVDGVGVEGHNRLRSHQHNL